MATTLRIFDEDAANRWSDALTLSGAAATDGNQTPLLMLIHEDELERFQFWAESEGKSLAAWCREVLNTADEALCHGAAMTPSNKGRLLIHYEETYGHQNEEEAGGEEDAATQG